MIQVLELNKLVEQTEIAKGIVEEVRSAVTVRTQDIFRGLHAKIYEHAHGHYGPEKKIHPRL